MANVPSYDTERLSFGPGIIYIGAVGSTPTLDIGAVKGDMALNIERVPLEVKQGSPQSLIKQYVVEENVSISGVSIEWNLDNIAYILGAGVTSVNGASEVMEFGGDADTTSRAVRMVHRTPDGGTIDVHIFDAQGAGGLAIAIKEQDMHELPFEFKALEASLDFTGATPATNKKKLKIIRTPA